MKAKHPILGLVTVHEDYAWSWHEVLQEEQVIVFTSSGSKDISQKQFLDVILDDEGLNGLAQECNATAHEKGWYDGPPLNTGERFMLMVTEIAEAMEEHRAGHKPDEVYYTSGGFKSPYPRMERNVVSTDEERNPRKPEGVPIELADAIIRMMDFCGENNIDIEYAVRLKMAYNKTRSYRHGGKLA